ncbi:hypothetical protein MKX01_001975 [Papaver californicum]|nr:hypothetical protein MKX01_001975 [Papaver californicum]
MKILIGGPGSISGLTLKLGEFLFASASIGVMVSAYGFSSYTAYCYLIASIGLQVLWSLGLACLDIYVTGFLSLAAASSSAGVTVLYSRDLDFCSLQKIPCSRYQISVAFATMHTSQILLPRARLIL